MSNLGFQILYSIATQTPNLLVDRCFTPWPDFEAEVRKRGESLRSLDHHILLDDFDAIGFTLQHELCYTNVLTMLSLGRIPLLSQDRDRSSPLIIGGGPCTNNPEPIADIFDAFLLGDGEVALVEILSTLQRQLGGDKRDLLRELAQIKGMYVPQFFTPMYGIGASLTKMEVAPEQPSPFIERRLVRDLEESPFPDKPLVPCSRVIHDRITMEVARGCKHFCRFCPFSTMSKPLRFRSPEKVLELAKSALMNTGHQEISLSACNIVDYPHLNHVIEHLLHWGIDRHISVSIPSIRPDGISSELARLIQSSRKTGFTIAPEAGSDRLRALLHKDIKESDVLVSAANAATMGWNLLKLYFMAGLPTETDIDLQCIDGLCRKILNVSRNMRRKLHLNVSVSFFVPKPHTPFQWIGQMPYEQLLERRLYLSNLLKSKSIAFKPTDPAMSYLEAVFARGDRRILKVLLSAWRLGCRFDNWSETFNPQLWNQSFVSADIDPREYSEANYTQSQLLAWDHLSTPSRKEFIQNDFDRFIKQSNDQRAEGLYNSIMTETSPQTLHVQHKSLAESEPVSALRISYQRLGIVKYLSHLDLVRIFSLALRRAEIPIAFSRGFNPHPRISFGPALPVGFESLSEYADLRLITTVLPEDVKHRLNSELPQGIEVRNIKSIPIKTASIESSTASVRYQVVIPKIASPFYHTTDLEQVRNSLHNLWQSDNGSQTGVINFQVDVTSDDEVSILLLCAAVNGKMLRPDALLTKTLSMEKEHAAQLRIIRQGFYSDREGTIELI